MLKIINLEDCLVSFGYPPDQHKRAGNPIVVWRNGQVEWIQPEDIPVDDDP
jgi:hypothetical protein